MRTTERKERSIRWAVVMTVLLTATACANTDLVEYRPKNRQEAEIVALLQKYEDAKKRFDLRAYLECLHEHGSYHFGGSSMVSKQRLATLLPGFWSGLQNNDIHVYPMARECLNGNFIPEGRLTNPKIRIEGGSASVTATFNKGLWRLRQYFYLIRTDGRWLIRRFEWATG